MADSTNKKKINTSKNNVQSSKKNSKPTKKTATTKKVDTAKNKTTTKKTTSKKNNTNKSSSNKKNTNKKNLNSVNTADLNKNINKDNFVDEKKELQNKIVENIENITKIENAKFNKRKKKNLVGIGIFVVILGLVALIISLIANRTMDREFISDTAILLMVLISILIEIFGAFIIINES